MKTLGLPAIATSLAILLTGCAAQGPPINTASGRPEIFIPNVAPQRVRSAVIDRAIGRAWTLDKETENTVSFVKKADNALVSVLLASNYDTNVMDRIRFTIIGTNGGTKMYASEEFVTNHGSAFEKITPLNNNNNSRALQNILESLKARFASKDTPKSSDAAQSAGAKLGPKQGPNSSEESQPSPSPAATP